ncbi:polymorphic toxin-type HINT domain-containing protein [Paenibacillus periandrae]|uniref:polymorphic toxin-type HINT domain-containing protein n=1 Tax=Paenibacillus periandrae TaxID=1761741 RepID=UPI001F08A327|nr:polymorphic toxin-type HINT domain-containing protein [Paenibacillus periandrae]
MEVLITAFFIPYERFIKEDTYEGDISNPLSLNLYTYVHNNPLTNVDPTGHATCPNAGGTCITDEDGYDKFILEKTTLSNNSNGYMDIYNACSKANNCEKYSDTLNSLHEGNMEIRNNACSYVDCGDGIASFTGFENGVPIITQEDGGEGKRFSLTPIGILECNCFTAGTLVKTEKGEKPIEEIQVGDLVLSKNEVTGEVAYKEVTATFNHETDEIYKIHVGDQTIEATFNHPFWVDGKGWTFVKDLKVGDLLVQSNGEKLIIDSIELERRKVTVYNMTVDKFHTYFVGDLGIWVHNSNCSEYFSTKAPYQVTPGIRNLSGQYINDQGRVEPWEAHYDQYGRLTGRTDYNAGNKAQGKPNTHFHVYKWGPGMIPKEIESHKEGVYRP